MAANQLVQARINETVKEEAAAVLAAMGLTGGSYARSDASEVIGQGSSDPW